jgi:hypothetical protein
MSFVIKKGHLYVTGPGSKRAYTNRLKNAQRFASRELADTHACDNEAIHTVEGQFKHPEKGRHND